MLNHSSEQTTKGNSQPVFVQQKKAQGKDMYKLYLSAFRMVCQNSKPYHRKYNQG